MGDDAKNRSKLPPRIDGIEVLRGLAALAVAWFHFTNTHDSWARATGSLGYLGVEVFFVLSGFVIPLAILRNHARYSLGDFPGFLTRRIVRLEPPYLLSVALVLVLWELSSRAPGFAGAAPEWNGLQVLFHIAYAIPLTPFDWLQPVYWTLAYEFVFYIFAGLLYPLYARPRATIWLACVGVVVLLCAVGFLPTRCMLFLIGMAVFRHMTLSESQTLTIAVIAACAAAMSVLNMTLAAGAGCLTALILITTNHLPLKGRHWKPLLWLGALSYSFYLVHVPVGGRVVNLLGRVLPPSPMGELLASLAALAVSLIFAAFFYRIIERPAIRASRRIRMRGASPNA